MTKHRSHSAAFKRQVAEEFIARETLHGLSQRHDISRQLIRIWVGKFEAGALDEDVQAADLIQEYEGRIAASRGGGGERGLGGAAQGSAGTTSEIAAEGMDFMSDQLFDGRPIRILTVVDIHTREGLSTAPRANFRAVQVVEVLDQLVQVRGKPKSLRVDNGPEFAGRLLDHWAYLNKIEIDFSRPGKPTDNAFIEAFNAGLRAECLNASWFLSLADARKCIEEWRCHYNDERPHSALGNLTLRAFANQAKQARKVA